MTRPGHGLVAALVAVLALALTGCSADRLGAAAVVDGDRITTDELQDSTQEFLRAVPGTDPAEAQLRILERMILSQVIERAADEYDVDVSKGQVAAERDDLLTSVGGHRGLVRALASQQQSVVLAPSYVDQWFRDRLLYAAITDEIAGSSDPASPQVLEEANRAVIDIAESMDIDVNPRYGEWDPTTGLSPLVSGGLSRPASELQD